MHYEKLQNGDLVISAISRDEQAFIDAVIAAIEAYKATFSPVPPDVISDFASTEHSTAAEIPESACVQENPEPAVVERHGHECKRRLVVSPPANVREWQDAQPVKMLDRYKVAPIDLPD
jgi:hypothetical protein